MSQRDWPGYVASKFPGRATHLRRIVATTSGRDLHRAACGNGNDTTDDVRRVSCWRCFKTKAYKEAATAALKEDEDDA